jgi:hypothetical protein
MTGLSNKQKFYLSIFFILLISLILGLIDIFYKINLKIILFLLIAFSSLFLVGLYKKTNSEKE